MLVAFAALFYQLDAVFEHGRRHVNTPLGEGIDAAPLANKIENNDRGQVSMWPSMTRLSWEIRTSTEYMVPWVRTSPTDRQTDQR